MTEALLRRPVPYPDESLRGYLIRLAQVNYTSPRKLYRLSSLFAGVDPKSLLMTTGKVDLSKLCVLTNLDEQRLLNLTFFNQLGKYANEEEAILRHISSFGTCSTAFCQVCPLCLSEQPYHRKLWEIRSVTSCFIHHCRLISNCPHCHKFISPIRHVVTHCNCKYDLRKCEVIKVPESEAQLVLTLNKKLFESSSPKSLLPDEISVLSFRHFLFMHVVFCFYFYKISIFKHNVHYSEVFKPAHLHEIAIKTYQMFIAWPSSFYSFLNDYRNIPKNYRSNTRKEFGGFFYQVVKHFESKEFKFILKSVRDYCEEENIKTVDLKKTKKKIENLISPVDSKEVKIKITQNSDEYISLKTAESILGIPVHLIRDLILLGEIVVVKGNKDHRYCALEDIEKLKELFGRKNPINEKVKGNEEVVPFQDIKIILNRRLCISQFIAIIINNKIKPCAINEGEVGFRRLIFYKTDVEQLVVNKLISIKEFSKTINVGTGAIYSWIKKGFINKSNKQLFERHELDQFVYRYVPLTTLVRMHTKIRSSERLHKWLDRKGIEPVSGPGKDGGKAYLYRKSPELMKTMRLKSWD